MSSFNGIPFLFPPPGQVLNFENPESRALAITVICSICLALMWPVFLMRIYAKVWVIRAFGWDDASSILATIGATSSAAAVIWGMKILGPHGWNVPATAISPEFIVVEVAVYEMVYGPTIFFAKLALFLLYFRIFSCDRGTKNAIYLGIFSNLLFYAAAVTVFGVFGVRRPGETWLSNAETARYQKAYLMAYVQGSFGVVSDIYIFVLPMPVLWNLHMTPRKKLGVGSVFFAGLIAILASILGLYYRIITVKNPDLTWRLPPTIGLAGEKFLESGMFLGSWGNRYSSDASRSNDQLSENDGGEREIRKTIPDVTIED